MAAISSTERSPLKHCMTWKACGGTTRCGNMSRATVAKETQLGQLVQIPLSPRIGRHLSVVYPKERFHSRVVAGFVEFAKQRLVALQGAGQIGRAHV